MLAFEIKMFEIKWGSILAGSGDKEWHSNCFEQKKIKHAQNSKRTCLHDNTPKTHSEVE